MNGNFKSIEEYLKQNFPCAEVNYKGQKIIVYGKKVVWMLWPDYVYILRSIKDDNFIYVGLAKVPVRRMEEHVKGKEYYTRDYRPLALVYLENCPNYLWASFRETEIQNKGTKYQKSICNFFFPLSPKLSYWPLRSRIIR